MNPKVIVIGAGMAGLSAASQLFKSGVKDVLILEASDRIGGRIHIVKLGTSPNPIELGANWIHGSSIENSVFAVAEKCGYLSPYRVLNRWSARFLKEDGTEVDRKIVSQAWKTFREIYDDAYAIEHTSFDKSFLPAVERALSSANADILYDMKCVFQTMLNYVRFHEGDELDRIAVKDVVPDIPGGDLHIPGGYKQILDTIKKDIPDSALLYNTEVININWNNQDRDTVTLTVRDGRKFEARHVLVTCSLGYLKQHSCSLFEPALPSSKANAIATLGFGSVNKIFLEFEKPIFKEANRGIAFAWENANEKIDASNWYKRLFGFDAVFTNPRIVLGWISGDGARAMESLTNREIKDTSMRLLRKFLKDDSIPEPVNFFATRWQKNPYILGSYSHRTPYLTANEQQMLAAPVSNNHGVPVLFFAGEATDTAHYGCTHAARDSGIKEANRIVQLLGSRDISTTSKL